MTRWLTLFVCLLVISLNQIEAQKSFSLKLEDNGQRFPIDFNKGKNTVELCGLTPGQTYRIVAVAAQVNQKSSFVVRLSDQNADMAAQAFSWADRPHVRQFVATTACEKIVIQASSQETWVKVPAYLSVACVSCSDEGWLSSFSQQAEVALLQTTGGVGASSLINTTLIGGNCFDVTNVTSSGPANSRGTFSSGAASINIANGVVLCTGNVNVLPGPNNANNASGNTAGFNVNSANDADLATLTTGDQYDVSKIEFDFKPTAAQVQFDFVFGSEEYCEYVNSNFNDVFGFFISGPGIAGTQNIALIPSTSTPVAINNVNHLTNTSYYVNNNNYPAPGAPPPNPPGYWPVCTGLPVANNADCQLDGWTTVFTAIANVQPCSTYHIKLAIADIFDGIYASAVFLRAGSFNAGGTVKATPVYPAGGQFVYEGCGQGYIRFIRNSGDINEPITINYTIDPSSTATAGIDYSVFPNPIIIPAGQTEVLIPITVFSDLIIEGDETIVLLLDNPCTCTQSQATFVIRDKPPLELEMDDQVLCGGSSANLAPTLTGGVSPFTYQWSTAATTSSINITTPGINTYSVTVTDACGQTSVESATVTLLPAPTATISGSGVLCEGASGTFNLTVNMTGTGPWDIGWSGGGSSGTVTFTTSPGTITVTEPGTYTLTSVGAGACTGTVTGSAVITEVDVNITLTPNNPGCSGASTGNITSSVSGGTGPYTYVWSPAGSGANPGNLPQGTYNVTVTSSQGCTETASATLTDPPLLTASLTAPNIDCNNPTSQADLDVNGGTPGYTYAWTGGASGASPTFNNGGTYTVTVTDTKGCTTTTSVTIAANNTLPTAIATTPGPINCNNSEITLSGVGSSTGTNFTYEWSGPGIVSGDMTLNPVVNAPGTYVITVTNTETGCTKTATATVVQNTTPPNAVIANPPNIGCTMPTLSLNANGSSTGANYSFVWSTVGGNFTGGTNTLTPTINQAGTYTILVTNNANGCTNEATVTVNGNTDPPTAVITPPQIVTCADPQVQIDASGSSSGGGFTYQWSGPGIASGQGTLTPNVSAGGVYTLTVTNTANNCTATATVTVTQNTVQPNAVATTPGPINCNNPEISISGVGSSTGSNFSYEWGGPGLVSGETTLTPVVDAPGTYILTVTDNTNGCTRTASVTVTQNITPPNAVIANPPNIGCNQPTVTLNANGSSSGANFTFVWSTGDGNFTGGTNTLSPTVNQAGTYTLVITNNTNGCTDVADVTISGNTIPPVAIINPPQTVTCADPQIEIDASGSSSGGGFTYQWAGPGIVSGQGTLTPTVNAGGVYTVTITDTGNNCTTTATVTVPQNTVQPLAVATTPGTISCQQPQLTLNGLGSSAGGEFVYEWGTNNGNIVSGETTLTPVIDQGGTYILTVTNTTNGCTRTASVTVQQNNNVPQVNAGPPRTLNCLNPTITINGTGSSGANFTYAWTAAPGNIVSGATTLNPVINQAGCYTLVVTNTTTGCTADDTVCMDENFDTPDITIAPPDILNCYNPTIEIDATGTIPNTGVNWVWTGPAGGINSGANSSSPTIDQPGTYNLTVTDQQSGCTDVASVVVTRDITPPVAEAGPGAQLSCTQPTYTLNGAGSSAGSQFEYEWGAYSGGNIATGETSLFPIVDEAGTYILTVTNTTNGCTATDQVAITANQNFPHANAGPDKQLNCNNPTVTIYASATPANLNYQWTSSTGSGIVSGAQTLSPVINQAGIYILVITNPANGCTDEASVEVIDNIVYPVIDIAPPLQLDCNNPTIELDANGSYEGGNGANLIYQWTGNPANGILNGATTPDPEIGLPGTYTLVIRNATSQCTATQAVVVTRDVAPPVAAANNAGPLTCQFPTVELSGAGSSTDFPFFYQWGTTNGNIVSGEFTLNPIVNQIGTYTLTVTNTLNGCTTTAATTVITNQTFPIAAAGQPQTLNCTNQQLNLNGAGSSTGNNIAYLWNTTTGNIVNGNNTLTPLINMPGTYNLSVINTQTGCTSTASVTVAIDNAPPAAVTAPGGTLSCTIPTLTLNGSGSSTGSNISYLWTTTNGNIVSDSSTLSPVINAVGTYQLLVTNSINGCTAVSSTTVNSDASLPIASAGLPDTLTCNVLNVNLNGAASSQGANYTYAWTGPGAISNPTILTPMVSAPGTYELKVTNTSNGCTALSTVNIAQDIAAPVADAGLSATLNCYLPTLQLQGSNSSTGPLFTYNWTASNGGNIFAGNGTLTPTVNQPGDFQLVVTNTDNGCQSTDVVTVNRNITPPLAEAGPVQLIDCQHPTVTIAGTGSTGPAFVYQWSTINGNIASGANTLTPVADAPGQYALVVTDTLNGCTATDQVTVNKDANVPVVAVVAPQPLTCATLQVLLDAQGSSQGAGITFAWTTPNGHFVSGQNTLTPMVDLPGQYVLTINNTNNNCIAVNTITVDQNLLAPQADAGAPAIISCFNPVLTLDGTASSTGNQYGYNWTTINGNFVTGQNTLQPQIDQSGFYTIIVTDNTNGCTKAATVQILLDQNSPEADAGAPQTITCTSPTLTLNGLGSSQGPNFVYAWTASNGGNITAGNNTLQPNIDRPGTYTLLVSNPTNGCTSDATVQVTIDTLPPNVVIANPAILNCQLTETTIDGSAGSTGSSFKYAWSAANGGSIVSGSNTPSPLINNPGTYNVLVTNLQTGCTSTGTVAVNEDILTPLANAGPDMGLNCTVTQLNLQGAVSNTGGNTVQFAWSTSGSGNIVSGGNTLTPLINKPGTYTLTITNPNNFCTSVDQVLVSQNITLPAAVVSPSPTLTCVVLEVPLNAVGSSLGANFSYNWGTAVGTIVSGGNTLNPSVSAPGTYTITVTNTETNCTNTASVTVPQDIVYPLAQTGAPVTLTCSANSINLTGTGSTGSNYIYQWVVPAGSNGHIVTGNTTLNPTVDAPGDYELQVTNTVNGCSTVATATVLQDVNAPIAVAAAPGELTCKTTSLTLSGNGSTVGSGISYQWVATQGGAISGGNTSLAPTITEPGLYILKVSNSNNGCTTNASIQVTENITPPVVDAGPNAQLTCTVGSIGLTGAASAGAQGATYLWVAGTGGHIVTGETTLSPTIDQPGQYTLIATDVYNGCTASDVATVQPDVNAPIAVVAPPAQLTCNVLAVVLNAGSSSQGANFTPVWSGPGITGGQNGLTPTVNQPGEYQLVITNSANGCKTTTTATVTQNITPPIAEAGPGFELTCSVEEGPLNAAGSSAGSIYAYLWTTQNGVIVSGNTSAAPVVNEPGNYQLLVTNVTTGCTSTDQVLVTRNTNYPSDLALSTIKPACGGQPGTIEFTEITGGVGPYLYSIDGGDEFMTANAFTGLTPGTYPLVVQDVNGCEYAETLSFPTPVEPTVVLPPNISLDFGDSRKLTATLNIPYYEVDSIIWSPTVGLTFTDKPNEVIAQPFQTMQYTVRIVNKDGCEDRAVILIEVGNPAIWVPNVINPFSTDLGNDRFYIFAKDNTIRNIRTLQIYDRWGNKVFLTQNVQPNDRSKGWDGSFRDQDMNPAVFVWWAEVELVSGEVILLEGDVTVVR